MSSSSNAQQVVQHNEYFLDGGDLYLVVAHTLFRVHSYFFLRESQIFRDIMTAPVPVGQVRQGGIDSAAIMVKGVTVEEFAKFLWVFYNKVYGVHNATLPEWLAILKLAQEYQFPEVKRLATSKLEAFEMPIAERIALYQNHMVDPMYLVPLYVKLCKRDEGPSDDETAIMGIKTSLIIFRAREKSISSPDDNDITRAIYSLFGFNPQTGPVLRRTQITRDVSTERARRVALRRSATSRGSGDQGVQDETVVILEKFEETLVDAEENSLVEKEDCEHMEIRQKELIVFGAREVVSNSTTTFRCRFSTVNSTHSTGAVAIFVVVPTRVLLLFFALSWTLLFFCMIGYLPSHVRIL